MSVDASVGRRDASMNETFANPHVLDFYRTLPFNLVGSADAMAAQIRGANTVLAYPPVTELLRGNTRVLDAGCGTGWFTNTIAYLEDGRRRPRPGGTGHE